MKIGCIQPWLLKSRLAIKGINITRTFPLDLWIELQFVQFL